jgi:ribosomal protein S18 acetylase RimI-like enzyme
MIALAEDMAVIRELWTEYWESVGLGVAFQGFARELADLPGKYGPPGGRLLLATVEGRPAGTAALRPLHEGACEIKRLYVRPAYRKSGLGRALLDRLVSEARSIGYREIFCDTLLSMSAAQRIYLDYGFETVEPYSVDPTPGAVFFRLVL